MSTDVLQDEMNLAGSVNFNATYDSPLDGLYFINLNKDKSVRLMMSRPDDLSEAPVPFENQHPHIVIIDDTAQSFCLTPRPGLDISCDGATSQVALELSESKTYKIVLGGQVIATGAKPSQFEAILMSYGLRVNYFARPSVFACATYETTNVFNAPIYIEDNTARYKLTITDAMGTVILDNELSYTQTTIGTGTLFPITGVVSLAQIGTTKGYLLGVDIVGTFNDAQWKVELKPLDIKSSVIPDTDYAQYGFTPTPESYLPTIMDGSAYWCINLILEV